MDQLKSLLTEQGINFADATFNTEDGIRGLSEQLFVSKVSTCQPVTMERSITHYPGYRLGV